MDKMEAHARLMGLQLANQHDMSLFGSIEPEWMWAAAATALAVRSGMLDECGTADDVLSAAFHGKQLAIESDLPAEAVERQIFTEARAIANEVLNWGEQVGLSIAQESAQRAIDGPDDTTIDPQNDAV